MPEKRAVRKGPLSLSPGLGILCFILGYLFLPLPLSAQTIDLPKIDNIGPARKPSSASQGMPAIYITEEIPPSATSSQDDAKGHNAKQKTPAGSDGEEQEIATGRRGLSRTSEEEGATARAAANGEAFLWSLTLVHLLAIAGGLLLGLVLQGVALLWMVRRVTAKLTPLGNPLPLAGGPAAAFAPAAPVRKSTQVRIATFELDLQAMSETLTPPPAADQREQAMLMQLFQQNVQLQKQIEGPDRDLPLEASRTPLLCASAEPQAAVGLDNQCLDTVSSGSSN